jgi:hypothetical protein
LRPAARVLDCQRLLAHHGDQHVEGADCLVDLLAKIATGLSSVDVEEDMLASEAG